MRAGAERAEVTVEQVVRELKLSAFLTSAAWPALSVILVIEVALGRHEEASPHALWH